MNLKKAILSTIDPYVTEWLDSSDAGRDADISCLVNEIEQERDQFTLAFSSYCIRHEIKNPDYGDVENFKQSLK